MNRPRRRAGRCVVAGSLGLAFVLAGLAPGVSKAEIRRLEAVGVVAVDPSTRRSSPPRDAAIQAGLREGVMRVAVSLLPGEAGGDVDPSRGGAGAARPEVAAVLGENIVDYTTRFRIVEDRGERPALFVENPEFETEYQVVVELFVDVDRVLGKLVDAGLVLPDLPGSSGVGVRVDVYGVTAYPAYQALRSLLLQQADVNEVSALEFGAERIVLDVRGPEADMGWLASMAADAPAGLEVVPLPPEDGILRLRVGWDPTAVESPEAWEEGQGDPPTARYRDGGSPGDSGSVTEW